MNIAVYGTLRKGMPNFEYFSAGLEHLDTVDINGYKLYAKKTLPIVCQTGLQLDKVKVDLLFVDSPEYSKDIDAMEINHGYYIDVIQIKGKPYKIYLYDVAPSGAKPVGKDWIEYAETMGFYNHRSLKQ